MGHYSKKVPTLVSNTMSNADELSRWILDWNGIQYADQRHAPGLHVGPSNEAAGVADGIANNPVLVTTDAVVSGKDGVLRYMEARCAPDRRLLPEDPQRREQAEELFAYFWRELWRPVGRYVYAKLLPHRACIAPLMTRGVPWSERLIVTAFYGILAGRIAKGLELDAYRPEEVLDRIERVFDRVEQLLSDGRRYLTGDTLTVADMMFATNAAPLVLPPEFRGSIARLEDLPEELRRTVVELQGRGAGQFALRIYRDHRPPLCDQDGLPKEPGLLAKLRARIAGPWLGRALWAWIYAYAGRMLPVLTIGRTAVVNEYALVTRVLDQDRDFTIAEINADNMASLSVPFFLGMDRSPEHDREFSMTTGVVQPGDLERIRALVRRIAREQIELAREFRRIDVVTSLAEVVMVRVLRDYLGVRGPTEAAMKRWMRVLFWDLFVNPGRDEAVHRAALEAAEQLRLHLEGLIAERRRVLDGRPEAGPDNLLDRMILRRREPGYEWLDDDAVRRNISGLIIGALPTNSKAIVLVLDELLDRPEELLRAKEAAARGDVETVHHFAYEALRFNPHNPVIARFSPAAQLLRDSDGRTHAIKAGSTVLVGLSAAMFDPSHYPDPERFDPGRALGSYLHFGRGYHECFGRHINAIVISEVTAAVLELDDLRRAPGRAGRVIYEGPFPNNFLLTFD
ncbi:MAG: cytochrome P450 [Myxococcales bacterium]|nr:cytochrome P450 [Myxococcales bacterium]